MLLKAREAVTRDDSEARPLKLPCATDALTSVEPDGETVGAPMLAEYPPEALCQVPEMAGEGLGLDSPVAHDDAVLVAHAVLQLLTKALSVERKEVLSVPQTVADTLG